VPLPLKVARARCDGSRAPAADGDPARVGDYFTHPTHYTTDEADRLLAEEGVTRPDRETWFRAMAAFVRAHPDVPSDAMI
jgi:hypothetical protein